MKAIRCAERHGRTMDAMGMTAIVHATHGVVRRPRQLQSLKEQEINQCNENNRSIHKIWIRMRDYR